MISFGIMTALLVTLVCLVHYDLLGLFPSYPFDWTGGGGRHTVDESHEEPQRPLTFDRDWLPRPGTDSSTFYRQPVILLENFDDGEDEYIYDDGDWSHVQVDDEGEDENETDAYESGGDGGGGGGGEGGGDAGAEPTCSADDGRTAGDDVLLTHDATKCSVDGRDVGQRPSDTTSTDTIRRPESTDRDDDLDDDEKYVAPGQERDDIVF